MISFITYLLGLKYQSAINICQMLNDVIITIVHKTFILLLQLEIILDTFSQITVEKESYNCIEMCLKQSGKRLEN